MNVRFPLFLMCRSSRGNSERTPIALASYRPITRLATGEARWREPIRAGLFVALNLCSACAGTSHTKVLVAYTRAEPIERVAAIEAVNATGRELRMPQAGVIEQVVRLVTRQPEPQSTVTDAFAQAASEHLADMNIRVDTSDSSAGWRLRVTLASWDVRDNEMAGAVVVVSANYRLLDTGGAVSWEVQQDRLPIRVDGPNLTRHAVTQIARSCMDRALESLPGRRGAKLRESAIPAPENPP